MLRIALLVVRSANSQQSWRGVFRSLREALAAAGAEVVPIEYRDSWFVRLYSLKDAFIQHVLRRRYQRHREPLMLRIYGRYFSKMIARHRIDAALALKVMPLPYTETAVPLILYNDAPFGALRDFYMEFTGLSAASIRNGEAMERAANAKARRSIYSSRWGAEQAAALYGTPPDTIEVIEMGANLPIHHTAADIDRFVDERLARPVWNFLWLGVNWIRKGGDQAVEVIKALRAQGYPVHLRIAGVARHIGPSDGDAVSNIGFLDGPQICEELRKSHFLLLPTRADCTPLVYNEANAFGVPVLSTDVGGIATSIRDGRNGKLFPLDAPAAHWARTIAPYLDNAEAYRRFAHQAFAEYAARLNWQTAAQRIIALIRSLQD